MNRELNEERTMITGIHASSVTGAGLPNMANTVSAAAPGASSKAGDTLFGDLISDAVGKVSQLEDQARTAVEGLMTGSGVDVHQAMIASEKANMAFEMALAVRNKAIQSYQSVMSMQF
jgi:flagellar hook-basal body complex protein FliE